MLVCGINVYICLLVLSSYIVILSELTRKISEPYKSRLRFCLCVIHVLLSKLNLYIYYSLIYIGVYWIVYTTSIHLASESVVLFAASVLVILLSCPLFYLRHSTELYYLSCRINALSVCVLFPPGIRTPSV